MGMVSSGIYEVQLARIHLYIMLERGVEGASADSWIRASRGEIDVKVVHFPRTTLLIYLLCSSEPLNPQLHA